MHKSRRGNIQLLTCVAIGCGIFAVLFVSIDGIVDTQTSAGAALPHELNAPRDLSPEDLYERVAPSVVTIVVKDEDDEQIGTGTGFFVDEAIPSVRYDELMYKQVSKSPPDQGTRTRYGYVLTNYHVIRSAVSADVVLSNGDQGIIFRVLAEDENADLALLLVCHSSSQSMKGIPFAVQNPRVLTTVYAIGSPKGLTGSASEGRVSGLRELSTGEEWLQTTAPISPGSSGGPLLLSDGTLAGVTTMFLAEGQNLNFAIPVSAVRAFLARREVRPRDVAEGASIYWHSRSAFGEMKAKIELSESLDGFPNQYTVSQKQAVALLEQAHQAMNEALQAPSGEDVSQCLTAIERANDAYDQLPDEIRYLAHYIAGKANNSLAFAEVMRRYQRDNVALDVAIAQQKNSKYTIAALRNFEQATRLAPTFSPAWLELARQYRIVGNFKEDLDASNNLVKLMPRCAEAFSMRAGCYSELNRKDLAVSDLRAAIELSPRNGEMHHKLAAHLAEFGEYSEAIESYEIALDLIPESMRRLTQYELGVAYKKAGNLEKAILAFRKAKDLGFVAIACDSEIAECRQQQR